LGVGGIRTQFLTPQQEILRVDFLCLLFDMYVLLLVLR